LTTRSGVPFPAPHCLFASSKTKMRCAPCVGLGAGACIWAVLRFPIAVRLSSPGPAPPPPIPGVSPRVRLSCVLLSPPRAQQLVVLQLPSISAHKHFPQFLNQLSTQSPNFHPPVTSPKPPPPAPILLYPFLTIPTFAVYPRNRHPQYQSYSYFVLHP